MLQPFYLTNRLLRMQKMLAISLFDEVASIFF